MGQRAFRELVALAEAEGKNFQDVSQEECLQSAKAFALQQREDIRERHKRGASGGNVVRQLSDVADEVVRGIFQFALAQVKHPERLLRRVSLCAQGGYGRQQLNPYSDLDIGILFTGRLDRHLRAVNEYMVPMLWDLGYENSFVVRNIDEALSLARHDFKVFTSYIHCRLLMGSAQPYGKMRLKLEALGVRARPPEFAELEGIWRQGTLSDQYAALFSPEPNLKEDAGGLRDYHAALWLLAVHHGVHTLDDAVGRGLISAEERLHLAEALDLLWRIRNELHFAAGKREEKLTHVNEVEVAIAFGYTDATERDSVRFMKDYYRAARALRNFLWNVARTCERAEPHESLNDSKEDSSDIVVVDGELFVAVNDSNWFEESPSRLMSVFWESARRGIPLSKDTLERVQANLELVNDTFRSNDLVRRFFMAICNRPYQAGFAFRQAAHSGLLGAYLPEFADVQDIIRYEDFHRFPVDEHTLQAVEALAAIPDMDGPVGDFLKTELEHLSDPYVLVLALLFHDLGKVSGEDHSVEGRDLALSICARIGLPSEDGERIAFLVLHHLLMTHNALYRDADDIDVVDKFASTMQSAHRLRALLLLSYADLSAVAPNVWSDWKGTLLVQLYRRTEQALLGRSGVVNEAFWEHPKADAVRAALPAELQGGAEQHLREFGAQYFSAFSTEAIATHIECLHDADARGFAVQCAKNDGTDTTDVVICSPDHSGFFEELAGCFVSQLVDVERAALFTRSDGMALDCFTVVQASRQKALTDKESTVLAKVFGDVLSGTKTVEEYLGESQRRIFALLHPPVPVKTDIHFDDSASRRYSVIDVITGDRTGLLYDIAHALTEQGLDIVSARIVTDARRVRDSFYVALNHEKVEDRAIQRSIEEALREAIHARPTVALQGEEI